MSGTGYVNPTYQSPAPQNLQTLLDAFGRTLLKNLNCVRPGVVQDFNPANQTATVEIAQTQVTSISPTGVQTLADFPLLLQVPVYVMGGGNCVSTFPIAAGDGCLLLFNDRQLDNWKNSGAGQPPSISRMHDLSDAICLVGLRPFPQALGSYSTTEAQLRSVDGATSIGLNATAQTVNIVAPGGVTLDTPVLTVTGVINAENTGSAADAFTVSGTIRATGDVQASGGSISLVNHVHSGVQSGADNTGPAEG